MPRHAPALLLGLALVCAAAMTLVLTSQLTFLQDTWEFLMTRRDPSLDVLFHPHNEHLVVFPVALEELFLRLFGMTSARPEYVVLTLMLLATAALLYVYLERRVGSWLALFATVVVLTLGPAWEVLLWPFEISFVGPVLFGLAMLLALERGDRGGDLLACVCLVAALGFSGLGIPFLAAGAVAIALGGPRKLLRRAWVIAVPVALFAVWYLHWGDEAKTNVTAHNVLHSPVVVAEAVSVSVGALFGLAVDPVGGSVDVLWGAALLVVAIAVLGRRAWRGARWDKGLWPVAAAALAFWVLMAFNQVPGRDATASRYQYGGAIFVLMIVANLLADWRPGRRTLLVCAAVTAVAVGLNLVVLHQGRDELAQQSLLTRSDTAAIEIARRTIDPLFQLNSELAGTTTLVDVFAGSYLEAVDEYGSPAYTPAELANAPEPGRRQADVVLAQALPLATVTQLGEYAPAPAAGCVVVAGGDPAEVPLAPGLTRVEVAPGPPAGFSLRRFAVGEFPVVTEGAPGESVTRLQIPADAAPAFPWRLHVRAQQEARVCPAPSAAG
jgi:hypothetical protein